MSPATQMVVAAGWLGTRRAIQATREGVTDLRNCQHRKFTFGQMSLTRCTGTRMEAGKDLHSQGNPIAPVGDQSLSNALFRCENFDAHIYYNNFSGPSCIGSILEWLL